MTLKQYEAKISQATTDKEITSILNSAFLQDGLFVKSFVKTF